MLFRIVKKMFKRLQKIVGGDLPLYILQEVNPLFANEQEFKEKVEDRIAAKKDPNYIQYTDEQLILNMQNRRNASIWLEIVVFMIGFIDICVLVFVLKGVRIGGDFVNFLWISHGVALFLMSIAYYQWKFIPIKTMTLDRQQGLITYPRAFRSRAHHTCRFNDISAYWTSTPTSSGVVIFNMFVKDTRTGRVSTPVPRLFAYEFEKGWAFFVWYMDKNRPLPPGLAFDPYREQDFQRRKAEGFPPPLYRSAIPTPEATPEQQRERELYWKDEEYHQGFPIEAGGEFFDPKVHTTWNEVTYYYDKDCLEPSSNAWHLYVLTDGRKVYAQTDNAGKAYAPPDEELRSIHMVVINKN